MSLHEEPTALSVRSPYSIDKKGDTDDYEATKEIRPAEHDHDQHQHRKRKKRRQRDRHRDGENDGKRHKGEDEERDRGDGERDGQRYRERYGEEGRERDEEGREIDGDREEGRVDESEERDGKGDGKKRRKQNEKRDTEGGNPKKEEGHQETQRETDKERDRVEKKEKEEDGDTEKDEETDIDRIEKYGKRGGERNEKWKKEGDRETKTKVDHERVERNGERGGERDEEWQEQKDGETEEEIDEKGERRKREIDGGDKEKDGAGDGEKHGETNEDGTGRSGERRGEGDEKWEAERDGEKEKERADKWYRQREETMPSERGGNRDGKRTGERDEDRDEDGERDMEGDLNGQGERDRVGNREKDKGRDGHILSCRQLYKEAHSIFILYLKLAFQRIPFTLDKRLLAVTEEETKMCDMLCITDMDDISWHFKRRKDSAKDRVTEKETAKVESVDFYLQNMKRNRLRRRGFHHKSPPQKMWPSFDLFDRFQPTPVSGFVYPVSRHTSERRGDSSEGGLQHQEPRPGPDRTWLPDIVHGMPWVTFRQELYRLGTFFNMPLNFPVFYLKLAEAGFLRLDNDAIVCFFCGLRKDDWTSGESPFHVQRRLRPDCPLVTGVNCDNVAVDRSQTGNTLVDAMRSCSLSETPGPTATDGQPQENARSNLTNLHTGQQNMDARKGTSLSATGGDDQGRAAAAAVSDAAGGSVQRSSNQNVIGEASGTSNQNVGGGSSEGRPQQPPRLGLMGGAPSNADPGPANALRPPIHDGTAQPEPPGTEHRAPFRSEVRQTVTYQQLGIMVDRPKEPNMAMLNTRLGTYRGWPDNHSLTTLSLSDAGFYYAGYADSVRCFQCGGGMKNWAPGDNPWVAHALAYPKCAYVRQCQGQDFIDIILEMKSQGQTAAQQISMNEVEEEIKRRQDSGDHIQALLVDPAISSAVHAGYRQHDVDSAAQRLLAQGYQLSADRLVDSLEAEGAVAGAGGHDNLPETASSNVQREVDELKGENSDMRQRRMCKICLDREVAIVFLPCGHLSACAQCAPVLVKCPVCRFGVKGRVRAIPS